MEANGLAFACAWISSTMVTSWSSVSAKYIGSTNTEDESDILLGVHTETPSMLAI